MNVTDANVKDLNLMASYFTNIQMKKSVDTHIRGIERIIDRVFGLNVKIHIVDNNTGQFFGMNVTPERMDRILMAILEEKSTKDKLYEVWREENNWVIEIDDLLLYDKNLNANGNEIVAVLLHEIGHVVYSNEAVSRANRVIKMTLMDAGAKYKKVLSDAKFRPLLQIPLYESCATKHFRLPKDNNREEYIADKFAFQYGYGESLVTFITKLLKTRGNGLIDRSESEMDSDVRVLVRWTVENVASLEKRKDKLSQSISIEERRNPSKVIKSIVSTIRDNIFGKNNDDDPINIAIKEQYMYNDLDRLIESASSFSTDTKIKKPSVVSIVANKKLKKIEVKELDILEVEIDRIEYPDDKIYLLELIHDLNDRITTSIATIEAGHPERVPQSKQSLVSLLERCNEMRRRVIKLDVRRPGYGLFIKYPKGYEG